MSYEYKELIEQAIIDDDRPLDWEEGFKELDEVYAKAQAFDAIFKLYDEADYCTKCTVKPIVKEHMCDECYTDHCQWLRELSAPKQDSDQWYTLYESEA